MLPKANNASKAGQHLKLYEDPTATPVEALQRR